MVKSCPVSYYIIHRLGGGVLHELSIVGVDFILVVYSEHSYTSGAFQTRAFRTRDTSHGFDLTGFAVGMTRNALISEDGLID